MRFKCVKEYDIAKPGEVWKMDYYINRESVDDRVLLHKNTEKSTVNLFVDVLNFDQCFHYVDIS